LTSARQSAQLGRVASGNLTQFFWSAVAWHRFGKSEHDLGNRIPKRCQATALQKSRVRLPLLTLQSRPVILPLFFLLCHEGDEAGILAQIVEIMIPLKQLIARKAILSCVF